MNDKNYNPIPKPDIRFEGKNALKKRGHFATIAWIGSSIAVAVVIAVAVWWPSDMKSGIYSETIAVTVQNILADTDKVVTVENQPESETNETQTNTEPLKYEKYIEKQSVNGEKDIAQPPQRRKNNLPKVESEVEKQIEPIRKREIRPTISIKSKVELAMVEIPKTDVNLSLDLTSVDLTTHKERAKNPNIEQLVQLFKSTNFVNSNLAKETDRDRAGNPNLKKLFKKPESSIKEVFFSKNDDY